MMKTSLNTMGQFYERLGKKIVQSENASWFEVLPRVLLSFPSYKLVQPQEAEIDALMREYKLRAIRYPTTLNSFSFVSTLAINTDRDYDLSCLHQKTRNQTRRGKQHEQALPRENQRSLLLEDLEYADFIYYSLFLPGAEFFYGFAVCQGIGSTGSSG